MFCAVSCKSALITNVLTRHKKNLLCLRRLKKTVLCKFRIRSIMLSFVCNKFIRKNMSKLTKLYSLLLKNV
jgi:hypothetical protein